MRTAVPPFAEEFHAEMVPSSVTKMKDAGFPGATSKRVVELNTCPVGEDGGAPDFGAGMLTIKALGWPALL